MAGIIGDHRCCHYAKNKNIFSDWQEPFPFLKNANMSSICYAFYSYIGNYRLKIIWGKSLGKKKKKCTFLLFGIKINDLQAFRKPRSVLYKSTLNGNIIITSNDASRGEYCKI